MPPQEYSAPDFRAPALVRAPEARFEPVPADGVLPEGFFSTSNLPTYLRVGGQWLLPSRPRMDCVIVRRGAGLEVIEPRRLRRGEQVAMGLAEDGSEGIYVHTAGFLGGAHSANEFRFMSTEVSRERPVNYEELAARLIEEKRRGGYLIWVAGPALVHSRARRRFRVVHPAGLRAGGARRQRRRGARHRGGHLRHHARHDQHRPADRWRPRPAHARHQPGARRRVDRGRGAVGA